MEIRSIQTTELRRYKHYIRVNDGVICQIVALSKFSVRYKARTSGDCWTCSIASFKTMFRAATSSEKRPFTKRTRQTLLAKLAELSK